MNLEYERNKIEENALNAARVAALGHYIEHGEIKYVDFHDRKVYEDHFMNAVKLHAADLIAKLAAAPLPIRPPL